MLLAAHPLLLNPLPDRLGITRPCFVAFIREKRKKKRKTKRKLITASLEMEGGELPNKPDLHARKER